MLWIPASVEQAGVQRGFESLAHRKLGIERGAADLLRGNAAAASLYLRDLEVAPSEASAERLYYLEECARHLNHDEEMMAALKDLAAGYPKSPWRLKALVAVANRYLLINRPDDYLPLYQAAYQEFPDTPVAAVCHWKVTFNAYLRGAPNAAVLLGEHLRNYSTHFTAAAALYFAGRNFEQQSDFADARAAYQLLVKSFENQYYAMLARDRLRTPELAGAAKEPGQSAAAAPWLAGLKFPEPKLVPAGSTPGTAARIARSRLLRNAGLADLADSELRFGARTDGQASLLAMELAAVPILANDIEVT